MSNSNLPYPMLAKLHGQETLQLIMMRLGPGGYHQSSEAEQLIRDHASQAAHYARLALDHWNRI